MDNIKNELLFLDKKSIVTFEDLIFLSLSNMSSNINENVIMTGINLESQLLTIKKFIKKKNKNKTIILYPKNEYTKHVDKNIKLVNFPNTKIFKYILPVTWILAHEMRLMSTMTIFMIMNIAISFS